MQKSKEQNISDDEIFAIHYKQHRINLLLRQQHQFML